MPVLVNPSNITATEAAASVAYRLIRLPSSGYLEAAEINAADKWLRYDIWFGRHDQTHLTTSLKTDIAVDHLSVICHIKLEPNMGLVGHVTGILTDGARIILNCKVSDL